MKVITYNLICLLILILSDQAYSEDMTTMMMQSTFKIEGPESMGTGFFIVNTDSENIKMFSPILITAAHVLETVKGDNIKLILRKHNENYQWTRFELILKIRDNGKPLWIKHPDVDLAGMLVNVPKEVNIDIVTTNFLLDDNSIKKYNIGPGDELLCLGYPFGAEANPEGFPILRSGKIASYPLIPTKDIKTFLFDFAVYRGNSGGPVYIIKSNPIFNDKIQMGTIISGIIGIVVKEQNITEKVQHLYETKETLYPLQIGEVIHASFIKDLLKFISIKDE